MTQKEDRDVEETAMKNTQDNNAVLRTGKEARRAARENVLDSFTSGIAPGYLQANLIVLPSRYADDFRALCARNPVPCPLIAESKGVGRYDAVISSVRGLDGGKILEGGGEVKGEEDECGLDLRRDAPRYMVYENSVLARSHCRDVVGEWTGDHVGFLVGCSYSFEGALTGAGLTPRHVAMGRNVPMYRTAVPLCAAGVFTGATYVVSMRPYRRGQVEEVRRVTRRFGVAHGEPIDWGWDAVGRLGIEDIRAPEWGDAPVSASGGIFERAGAGWTVGSGGREEGEDMEDMEEEVPVFWGCGVTPQEAVMRAGLKGTVMAHAPGHMIVLDAKDEDIVF